jgi:Peptidase family S41
MKLLFSMLAGILLFSSCQRHFDPQKTYNVAQIKADYALMRAALEEAHPGLHRYTTPDSMRLIMDQTEKRLDHPMTEREFRRVVNPVFSFVRCGHTDIYPSKAAIKYAKKNKPKDFPLSVYWSDQKLRIMQNRTNDTTLKIGTEIVSLDGRPTAEVIADMQLLIPSDGYNTTYKNVVINNSFGGFYRYLTGSLDSFRVAVKDTTGKIRSLRLTFNKPPTKVQKAPTLPKPAPVPAIPPATAPKPEPKLSKSQQRRRLTFSEKDSTLAILDINTFRDANYARFYRRSFKTLQQRGTKNLVIDLRNNGGGRSDASLKLMSYLLDSAFVVYRQVEASVAKPSFNKHLGWKFMRWGVRNLWSKKTPTGGLLNRATGKTHKPARKHHFDGNVFVLTNGGSFSASAIFSSIVQFHGRAKIIGRETGGGRYGCNAFVSPMLTLPNTKAEVRMPMFKIVLNIPGQDAGRGVMPNCPVPIAFDDAQKGRDKDMEKVYELLKTKP